MSRQACADGGHERTRRSEISGARHAVAERHEPNRIPWPLLPKPQNERAQSFARDVGSSTSGAPALTARHTRCTGAEGRPSGRRQGIGRGLRPT
eukprot:3337841-Prymnesium_polylepis.1